MTRTGKKMNSYLKLGVIALISGTIGGAFLSVYQIWLVRIMQKRDPSKKGDPAELRYNRDWIESCDEAEWMRIYKTGYKSFAASQWVLIIGWLMAFLCKINFNLGNGPILIVGGMWIAQMIIHGSYKFKLRKSRLD